MNGLRLVFLASFFIFLGSVLASAAPKEKTPAEIAWDEFSSFRLEKDVEWSDSRQQKLAKMGVSFLADYPSEAKALEVIKKLVDLYSFTDKKKKAQCKDWMLVLSSKSTLCIVERNLSTEASNAIYALDTAILGAAQRNDTSPEAMKAWREAIDELETRKGARTFWKDRESDFMNYLKAFRSNQFEEYIVKALAGPDKGLHWWMREELSMVEVAKQPFAFAFTTAGGTAVDFANLRGKIVYLYFWSLESPGKKEDLDSVKELYGMNRKQFEVIGVACGTDEDRVKILEFIQSKRLKWPQSISGPVENLDVAKKLNVTAKKLPTGFVFDGGGILIDANLSPGNLKWSLEKYLARLK